jgi:hypothetical protein
VSEPIHSETEFSSPLSQTDIIAAAIDVVDAYTAEAEDWNDGEFALWQKDDLVNAIVKLRKALGR